MGRDPLIGRQLGNFRIERLVGSGGMAQVYYGWDVVLQRPVAVKVIAQRFRHHTSYTERFLREARTVARWRHEHIVQVYHAAEEDGLYYLVMEYVDGSDLAQLLRSYEKAGKLLPHDEVLRIARDVAGALDFAHQRDVIHRDVKPSNVLITAGGRVLLSDFGLVLDRREGSSGEVLGSPSYVAPEQALRSASAVPQSDLYSLAVILYEMLAGRPPFDDPSPTSLALQHITASPPAPTAFNPDLNEEVSGVLLKALSKKPEERYQSGVALVQALSAALGVAPATEPLLAPQPRYQSQQEQEWRAADTHPTDPSPPPRLSDIPSGLDTGGESSGAPLVASPRPSRPARRPPSLLGRLLWMGLGFTLVMLAGLLVAFLLLRGDGAL
ncbi:MAG: serine/threonine-protein kinase, partial [Chloroflexota bacterium]